MTDLEKIVDNFVNKKVLVVGDVILDHYICGDASRLSPEAPIPIVNVKEERYVLGGAANVAANVAALGGTAYLCGSIGKDSYGKIFKDLVSKLGINLLLYESKELSTIVKTRVVANRHQLVRFDFEKKIFLGDEVKKTMINKISHIMDEIDVIVLSDYNKGVLVNYDFNKSLGLIADTSKKPMLVDPKPVNISKFPKVDCIAPNLKEALEIIHQDWDIDLEEHKEKFLLNIANMIDSSFGQYSVPRNTIITCGKEGMFAFNSVEKTGKLIPAKAREVYDVSGAGDTALAVLALAWKQHGSIGGLYDSCELANAASGVVVGKLGTATLTREELKANLKR